MKRVLVTGANSYIGKSFAAYMNQFPDCQVETVSLRDDMWTKMTFYGYDSIVHTAGIVHRKEDTDNEALYYQVNRDLTIAVAEKAKEEGVKQFVFLSSMSVYGIDTGYITKDTIPSPVSNYGKSKLQAEEKLWKLESGDFKLCILRPPMIYGKNCKGNYHTLVKIAKQLPVFPKVNNYRSMLYIGNLVEFLRLMIENEEQGTFFPQNHEYSNTSALVQMIAKAHGKKVLLIPGMTWAMKLLSHVTTLVDKAFGTLVYDQNMSGYQIDYRRFSLEKSVEISEQ